MDSRPYLTTNLSIGKTSRIFFTRQGSAGDRGAVQQIFHHQDYNLAPFPLTPKLARYHDACTASGRTALIIDAGANIGASVVYFLARHPHIAIVAIEPEPNNCELLRKNCFDLGNVRILEAAIGSAPGRMWLSDPNASDMGFRVGEQGTQEVEVLSIPQILQDFPADSYAPFICKVDIEGGERYLFEKDTEWVAQFPLIIIELHDWILPGKANSRNFLKTISQLNFDFIYRGENVFCFNNDLLK